MRTYYLDEDDVYTPGTDLLISLVTILLVVFTIVVREKSEALADLQAAHVVAREAQTGQESVLQEIEDLRAKLKEADVRTELDKLILRKALDDVAEAERKIASAEKELLTGREELSLARKQIEENRTLAEKFKKGIHKDLLGLKGELDYVVFVVDRSASMNDQQKWTRTSGIIQIWMGYLPVRNAKLVIFGGAVETFPANEWLPGSKESGQVLSNHMTARPPGGGTPMLEALTVAGALANVTTVIMFTDGKPSSNEDKILEQSRRLFQGKKITVNTVGVGVYYEDAKAGANSVKFLKDVAELGGGNYLGY